MRQHMKQVEGLRNDGQRIGKMFLPGPCLLLLSDCLSHVKAKIGWKKINIQENKVSVSKAFVDLIEWILLCKFMIEMSNLTKMLYYIIRDFLQRRVNAGKH